MKTKLTAKDRSTLLALAWTGPLCAILSILGLVVIGGFVPPVDPSDSAQEVADYYADNDTRILIGMIVGMTGFTMFATFGVAVAVYLRDAEDRPILTYLQIALVAIAALEGIIAAFIWGTAAFRPEDIDPEITRMLNDFGWFAFLFDIPPFAFWIAAIAVLIFRDTRKNPAFPRWVAYFNLWVALLIWPAELMAFFKTGPFAFNGAFALYLPAGLFFAWVVTMSVVLIRKLSAEKT